MAELKFYTNKGIDSNCIIHIQKQYKVVLAGKYGVGKTSIFRRMFGDGFYDDRPSGIARKSHKEIFDEENTDIELEIWDTAGMERHGSITQSYYRGSHFVLLVYSANDESSLFELEDIADDVQKYEPSAKLFLVRNKTDLPIPDDGVDLDKQSKYVDQMTDKNINDIFSTSAKENEGIKELLTQLANHALKLLKARGKATTKKNVDPFVPFLGPQKNEGCCS